MRMPPGWDGLDTIDHIWTIDPHIQMVISTAYSDHSWEEIDRRFGRTDRLLVLQKPFQSIEVAQRASSLTRKWELAAQARLQVATLNSLVSQRTAELTAANATLQDTIAELEASHAQIMAQNEELHRLATRDPLTGVLNRRAFFAALEHYFSPTEGPPQSIGCIMVDIDHFKRFNDMYGHAVGDQVLAVVASHLIAALRPQDLLARYGGEEFCVMIPGATSALCEQIADRLRTMVAWQSGMALRSIPGLQVTASFGVAATDSGGTEAQHLINQADKALYAAKRAGRNCVRRFDQLSVVEDTAA